MRSTALIDIRSCYNVGSIIRSASFFGLDEVICVGVTPHPTVANDTRLPHVQRQVSAKINKVSLGSENNLKVIYLPNIEAVVEHARNQDQKILALEQDETSTNIHQYPSVDNFVILLGEETSGLEKSTIDLCDDILEIKRSGVKESLNVSSAAAVAYAYFDNL